jgi:prefoldin subunit 5
MFNSQERIEQLEEENRQLKEDIEYLAADRQEIKKYAEKLEEQLKVIRDLYECEADKADDLAHEVSRLNKILKGKK